MTAPVAVIGAGVVGAAIARAIQRMGRPVLLIDPAPPGSGCSAGNAGHVAIEQVQPLARAAMIAAVPRMLAKPDGPLALRWRGVPGMVPWFLRMALAARPSRLRAGTSALAGLLGTAVADWRGLLDTPDLAGLLRHEGALALAETAAGARATRDEAALMAAHGVRLELLEAGAARARVPGLAAPVAGGAFFPEAAHALDPRRLVQAVAAAVVADGGTLLAEPLTGLVREDGHVAAVETPTGRHAVSAVVLAAGLASRGLARHFGARLPMTGERGYHAMLPPGEVPLPCPVSFAERGFIATPMADGTRLAGTVELGAAGRTPDWNRAEILVRHARDLFGTRAEAVSRWQGDRPSLPDYLPAIGRAPGLRNGWIATGHQHLGLTLAAVTARHVAAGVVAGAVAPSLSAFDPGRFGRVRE